MVTLTTTGCCLYMGSNGIEAVGSGVVTAQYSTPTLTDCEIMVLLNGSTNQSAEVEDGDSINIEMYTNGSCSCCETKRDCTAATKSLWIQKKDGKSIVLDKQTLMDKVKFAAERVRNKRRRLRGQ
jgi:hypothetical protein